MHINELTATFGRIENETLALEPGLNVIQAPNETGKSTWTAFLRVMLFGLNTRDRAPTAEKRRYPPWSGSPMQGRMDISTSGGDISIIRRTARSNSPMGSFSANYVGTARSIIKGFSCGSAADIQYGLAVKHFFFTAKIKVKLYGFRAFCILPHCI